MSEPGAVSSVALQLYRVTMHRNGGFARLPRSFLVSILVAADAAAVVHGITAMTLLEAEMMIRNPLRRRRCSKVSIQM